jgi:diguanylate cyclase (GGDEF)-like protein
VQVARYFLPGGDGLGLADFFRALLRRVVESPLSPKARTQIAAALTGAEPQWPARLSEIDRLFDERDAAVSDPLYRHVIKQLEIGHGITVTPYDGFAELAASGQDDALLLAVGYAAQAIPKSMRYTPMRMFPVKPADLIAFVNQVLEAEGYARRVTERGIEAANPGERPAIVDDKFGILRKYAESEADFKRWSADGAFVAFLFFDIDNFKTYNTRLHETTVDKVILPPFQRLVHKTVGDRGGAYTLGKGDEFGVLLRNVTPAEAHAFALRLLEAIRAARFPNPGQADEKVTVSIGVACAPRDGDTMGALREHANEAEHRAKEAGKNCAFDYVTGRIA